MTAEPQWQRVSASTLRSSDGCTVSWGGGRTRGFDAPHTLTYRDQQNRFLTIETRHVIVGDHEDHYVEVLWSKVLTWDPPHDVEVFADEFRQALRRRIENALLLGSSRESAYRFL